MVVWHTEPGAALNRLMRAYIARVEPRGSTPGAELTGGIVPGVNTTPMVKMIGCWINRN